MVEARALLVLFTLTITSAMDMDFFTSQPVDKTMFGSKSLKVRVVWPVSSSSSSFLPFFSQVFGLQGLDRGD